jgi:carbon starvation protein
MNAMPLVIAAIAIFALAYRFYFSFISAKVLALDPTRPTPATLLYDDRDYVPMKKWIVFGHHFAAIAGAGPLFYTGPSAPAP